MKIFGTVELRRKQLNEAGDLWLAEGEYGKDPRDGAWYLRLPGMHAGSLAKHSVVEHDDGTITVSPSILHTDHFKGEATQVHGYLERGVWRDV